MADKTVKEDFVLDWFGEEVAALFTGASVEGLEAAGFEIQGQAQQNIIQNDQVDTGFMVNSVYTSGPNVSSYGPAQEASNKNPGAQALPEEKPANQLEVIVAVAAEYAIWQEILQPFLYPALEKVAQDLGGHIKTKAKAKGF